LPSDFENDHPLAWVQFQRKWEEQAFIAWWSNYDAPAQLVWDFLKNIPSKSIWKLDTTYKPWIKMTSLNSVLPSFVIEAIREALPLLDQKIKWFADSDALLVWIESRTSSVVRFYRDSNTFESNIAWIYPTWEWAWYAWWITSSSIDWLVVWEAIIEKYI
jgi:uncharacterized FAD-dependent dehydrogenase